MEEATKKCPFCAETILAEARKCRFCGEFLDPALRIERPHSATEPKLPHPARVVLVGVVGWCALSFLSLILTLALEGRRAAITAAIGSVIFWGAVMYYYARSKLKKSGLGQVPATLSGKIRHWFAWGSVTILSLGVVFMVGASLVEIVRSPESSSVPSTEVSPEQATQGELGEASREEAPQLPPLPEIRRDISGRKYKAMMELGGSLQAEDTPELKRLAAAGDVDVMCVLGAYYAQNKDLESARAWWRQAASRGNVYALMGLGDTFSGSDESEKRRYYSLAAEKKVGYAERVLAEMMLEGRGGPRQIPEGKKMLLAAAQDGDEEAMNIVGAAQVALKRKYDEYFDVDLRLGEHYLRTAASRGNGEAKRLLREAYQVGVLVEERMP